MSSRNRAVIYLRVSTKQQVMTGMSDDGLSISAQEDICRAKAEQLGADVVGIYKDKGETARKRAGRDELARMFADIETDNVDFVIVYKLDRFARNTQDDSKMSDEIAATGARLISVSEDFDDSTPQGWFTHRMFAVFAEFESKQSGQRISMGMAQKAKLGGTTHIPPAGYLNARDRPSGSGARGIAKIIVDEERAPHVRWAFDAYATGEWSIRSLTEELEQRGLRSRPSRKSLPTPLRIGQVQKMLRDRYYIGYVKFKDEEYPGTHPKLIDVNVFMQVQDLLTARRKSSTRYRTHDPYLKGSIFCKKCEGRFYFRRTTNRHGTAYEYFICRGRNNDRSCATPHLSVEEVEAKVEDEYRTVWLDAEKTARLRSVLRAAVEKHDGEREAVGAAQELRLKRLLNEEKKNAAAYHADAMSLEVLREEKNRISGERLDAKAVIERSAIRYAEIEDVVLQALDLADNWQRTYLSATPKVRRALNQVFFKRILLDESGDAERELTDQYKALIDLDDAVDQAERASMASTKSFNRTPIDVVWNEKNPESAIAARGSHKISLVHPPGLEPGTCGLRVRCSAN